jgi:hypothetical protein
MPPSASLFRCAQPYETMKFYAFVILFFSLNIRCRDNKKLIHQSIDSSDSVKSIKSEPVKPQIKLDFADKEDELYAYVGKLVDCEKIAIKTTQGDSLELTIRLINCKNAPKTSIAQDSLGIKIARRFKNTLGYNNQISGYTVLYVKETSSLLITKSTYTGHTWKTKEL